MSGRFNPAVERITPYQGGKPMSELTRELGLTDIVKLASNENPRGPGEAVQEAIARGAKELTRYPDGNGFRLKSTLAELHGVDPAQITLGNGSNDVLDLAARVTLEPGCEAISSEHAFVVYRLATIGCNADLVTVPAKGFGADLDGFLQAVTDRTRIISNCTATGPRGGCTSCSWHSGAPLRPALISCPGISTCSDCRPDKPARNWCRTAHTGY